MCNLYTNKSTVREMANLFGTPATYGFNAPADVYPQYPGIVVREDQGRRILQQMTWGFVGNRINRAVRLEAARIVADGLATREQVDMIMREGFRWPMGPFELQGGRSLS